MIEEAELIVTRAMEWFLESYNRVGGVNTLRGIRADLKESQ